MGGGDLNTKKSWHPSTLKNQERVWKAEQAATEEKKRILELQREREQENDRAQLNEMALRNFGAGAGGSHETGDNRLHWMYDKPDKQVQHEDYLLGKEIGKSDQSDKPQNAIPALSRRVVGSSMTKTLDDTQVDLARKLREDPLILVKERERAARAALLNNPLQRKRLADLLRKEKEQKESKDECKTKKKSKKKNKNLDDMLAAKLNALGGKKGIDLSSLLNANDSSSESSESSDEKAKKKKKKKDKSKKKPKKSRKNTASDLDSSDNGNNKNKKRLATSPDDSTPKYQSYYSGNSKSTHYDDRGSDFYNEHHKNAKNRETDGDKNHRHAKHRETDDDIYHKNTKNRETGDDKKKQEKLHDNSKHESSKQNRSDERKSSESKKRRSNSYSESDGKYKEKRSKREYLDNRNDPDKYKRCDSPDRRVSAKKSEERRQGLSSAEKAAKLAEMVAAGHEREVERGQRVARQRAADAAAESNPQRPTIPLNNQARAIPDSLESRIKSNRHYIQRDKMHMNQNFARR